MAGQLQAGDGEPRGSERPGPGGLADAPQPMVYPHSEAAVTRASTNLEWGGEERHGETR